jgi:hypothetical protein
MLARMVCLNSCDPQPAQRSGVTGGHLHDLGKAPTGEEPAAASAPENGSSAIQRSKGRKIGVVVMQVREKHGVEVFSDIGAGRGAVAYQRAHTVPQHWIGEEPGLAELHQGGRMADPGDAVRHGWSRQDGGCVVSSAYGQACQ